jgi:putative oxygen-independent coproporphyrinogen III oxidase
VAQIQEIKPLAKQILCKSELPGLYVHIPLCLTKCSYCDFYSITDTSRVETFLQALRQEMSVYADSYTQFDTLYLGGGTPSLLAIDEINDIIKQVHHNFILTAEAEITLEANPDDVTPEKLRLWRELGVNRLSLGVQSLDGSELRFLGRRHNAAQARRALDLAREAGFDNLSADLIYALPGQTEGGWLASLEGVLAWQPEHLSCYQLTLEEHTPLGRQQGRGEFEAVGEEGQRRFFLLTAAYLESRGYRQYEISNFARGVNYIARHNSKYWRGAPYLGLGPAAHSYEGRRRHWNVSSVAAYCRMLGEGRAPLAGQEELTAEQRRLETVCLGLRTSNGVALADLDHFPQARQVLVSFCEAGLLRIEQGRARPTREGLLVADSLADLLSE